MKLLFISPKDVYASKRIVEEGPRLGLEVEHIAPSEAGEASADGFDAMYSRMVYPHYKEVANLAARFRKQGKFVIEATDTDKLADYGTLSSAGVTMPKTLAIDKASELTYPFIVKTKYGFGKKEVFLVKDEISLHSHTLVYESKDLIAQEFVKADWEYKVITVGYKSIEKVLRFKMNSSGFGVNPEEFEVLIKDECPKVVGLAEKASKLLNRELAKVDIIQRKGELYVLEVNQSPGFKSFEKLTGYNVAGEFVKYIIGRKA